MKTIAFDFDGVIHKYQEGWKDGSIYDEPDMHIVKVIRDLLRIQDVSVIIISTRDPDQINEWIRSLNLFPSSVIPDDIKFWYIHGVVGITNRKLPAMLYVDDRAFRYSSEEFEDSASILGKILEELNI